MVINEELLDVAHHAECKFGAEDTRVLGVILLEDVRLHRPAHDLERVGFYPCIGLRIDDILAGDAEQTQTQSVIAGRQGTAVARAVWVAMDRLDRLLRSGPSS